MAPINLNDFMGSGLPVEVAPEDIANPTAEPMGMQPARPSVPTYAVQPGVWLIVTLAACVVGLYFFLE